MSAANLRRLIVIGLIALWEILPRAGLIPELFLPSLSSTLTAGWNEAGEYGHALAVTLYEVAISMAFGPERGLAAVDALADEPSLKDYHLLPSVRGDLLFKLGRLDEARAEFEKAAGLTRNERERTLLLERAAAC